VVATPQAHEGIDATPGRDLVVEAGAPAFARAVAALLADRARGDALGAAGRARMVAHYRWSTNLAMLDGWLGVPTPAREQETA
jgi:glycosyltransferase involved in cell wall biosynthesis